MDPKLEGILLAQAAVLVQILAVLQQINDKLSVDENDCLWVRIRE